MLGAGTPGRSRFLSGGISVREGGQEERRRSRSSTRHAYARRSASPSSSSQGRESKSRGQEQKLKSASKPESKPEDERRLRALAAVASADGASTTDTEGNLARLLHGIEDAAAEEDVRTGLGEVGEESEGTPAPAAQRTAEALAAAQRSLLLADLLLQTIPPGSSKSKNGDGALDPGDPADSSTRTFPLGLLRGWQAWLPWGGDGDASSQVAGETSPSATALNVDDGSDSSRSSAEEAEISIRPFLYRVKTRDLRHMRKLATLCAFAYFIPKMEARKAHELLGLELVTTSLRGQEQKAEREQSDGKGAQTTSSSSSSSSGNGSRDNLSLEVVGDRDSTDEELAQMVFTRNLLDVLGISPELIEAVGRGRFGGNRGEEEKEEEESVSKESGEVEHNGKEKGDDGAVATKSRPLASVQESVSRLMSGAREGSGFASSGFADATAPLTLAAAQGSEAAANYIVNASTMLGAAAAAGGQTASQSLGSLVASVAEAAAVAATTASEVTEHPGCPCEWFVVDDPRTRTRTFVVQGSDSVASWRSNLTFDPMTFEDPELGINVHRGVYEAAIILYDQLLPLVLQHLASHPFRPARVAFTGHSLGGSIATLLTLMLHCRRPLLRKNLSPVYTFGSPAIFCGGACTPPTAEVEDLVAAHEELADQEGVLERLHLPVDFIRNILMHLDIVPRAFACDYTVVQGVFLSLDAFKDHKCLRTDAQSPSPCKMYTPTGIPIVLQPDPEYGPQHPYLPDGSAVYAITDRDTAQDIRDSTNSNPSPADLAQSEDAPAAADAESALYFLLNRPHPLEYLADIGAYGPKGTISRFHNPFAYSRVIAGELSRRKAEKKLASPLQKTADIVWRT
mmetsp:Transcript_26268/g.86246  ORF Transcript_26268/g.86246 Transcript_26268/m.86246 type:complete len:854 (+) Transcript_26268:21-2582(+)|eukprot:CAMPEP_0170144246 /NCGR_PEP_ID=MMETSP0033_2-20121228/13379_1 /TAXON_ID=195969 /ORGANISM="Dolichomastix tenuilepis, Strain CCMP3274" /LENGTH=853 /DNA_ID=CAMNT_0010380737 /DNA_START=16 /DNA_END=2577 /DNA_ORIENTATION=-